MNFLVFSVKYLREVTPYFRKTSALNDVGWGGGDMRDQGKVDKRSIPLKLCYICRNLTMPDAQNRIIELHSPDGKHSCILRCGDDHIASQWFSTIHSQVYILLQQALSEANHALTNTPSNTGEIKYMGWLAEQVCTCHTVNLTVK